MKENKPKRSPGFNLKDPLTGENKNGRPEKYNQKTFADKIAAYLEMRTVGEKRGPVTLLDFCVEAGVDKHYISAHDLNDGSVKDFSTSIKVLKAKAERDLEFYGLTGKFNPTVTIFSLKNNYGWKDKTEQEITGKDGERFIPLNPQQEYNIATEMLARSTKKLKEQE